ncbi:quinone-dependent dihydroorotate dehydrogenase [Georgenia satyanarayanai]|uniref:quinone-dependent dihydroorotate dehydrogenase n=1 Tax=Georgenia satyanarayanai TaxID=860221 RepID=UPI00126405BF|nr:quinone-dependent dihydroorotate dehydrogenase [Georgenia satyanarayanai]
MRPYRLVFRSLLLRTDPERAHELALRLIRGVAATPVAAHAVRATLGRRPTHRVTTALGRPVPGVLGLAAGMDKDARSVVGMDMLGFGHVEVGTITAHAQPGNDRPRLWRHPEEGALRNRMGFNNAGAEAAARRLRALRSTRRGRSVVVGVNIGKSRVTPVDDAVGDYATSARLLARWADYLTVNVSSPNTPGLRDLQSVDALRPILTAVQREADAAAGRRVPVLVKVAPDLDDDDVTAVADLVTELSLAGVVATNTTIAHDHGPGGLSGRPLQARALEVVRLVRERLAPDALVIGVGGIDDVASARRMLDAGADLLQAYSAFVYQGPAWPGSVNRALARR